MFVRNEWQWIRKYDTLNFPFKMSGSTKWKWYLMETHTQNEFNFLQMNFSCLVERSCLIVMWENGSCEKLWRIWQLLRHFWLKKLFGRQFLAQQWLLDYFLFSLLVIFSLFRSLLHFLSFLNFNANVMKQNWSSSPRNSISINKRDKIA